MGATETETARDVVSGYFAAITDQDMKRAVEHWEPGCIDRIVGFADLVAPDEIREWFGNLFAAAPDARLEVTTLVAEGDQVAVRWRMSGTFNGTGKVEVDQFRAGHALLGDDALPHCQRDETDGNVDPDDVLPDGPRGDGPADEDAGRHAEAADRSPEGECGPPLRPGVGGRDQCEC